MGKHPRVKWLRRTDWVYQIFNVPDPRIRRTRRLYQQPCDVLRSPFIDHESFYKVVHGGRFLVSHAYWSDYAEEQLRQYEAKKPDGISVFTRPAAWYAGIEKDFKQVFIYEDTVDIRPILQLPFDSFDRRCRAVAAHPV